MQLDPAVFTRNALSVGVQYHFICFSQLQFSCFGTAEVYLEGIDELEAEDQGRVNNILQSASLPVVTDDPSNSQL